MQISSKRKPYDEINITPMLDLAYVLLIIFIIMTTAAIQGIKVNVPKASSSVSWPSRRPRRSRSTAKVMSTSTPTR